MSNMASELLSIYFSLHLIFFASWPISMPGGGMSMWPRFSVEAPLSRGAGLGFLRHKSVIPEQRWSGMPEIWREIILSSYCAFIPIAILIAFEKRALSGLNSGEEVPKNVF